VLLDDHAWLSVWAKTRRDPSAPTVVTHWLPLHQHLANTTDTAGSRGGARLLTVRAVQPHEGAVEVAASIGLRAESIGGQVRRDVEQAVDPAEGLDRGRDKPGAGVVVGDIEPPPFVPGGEVVGTRCDTGERVAALCRTGGHAQYVAVPRELLFAIPDGVDDPTALSVFVPGLTAALLVNAARPSETDRVAVLGATGAVGSLLLGLLVERGVRTRVVSVRDQAARAEAAGLGATGFAYPGSGTLTEDLNTAAGGPLDIVFDAVGGTATEAAVSALGRFGRLFCYGSAGGFAMAVLAANQQSSARDRWSSAPGRSPASGSWTTCRMPTAPVASWGWSSMRSSRRDSSSGRRSSAASPTSGRPSRRPPSGDAVGGF
jgi:hypothetical protein